MIHKILFTFLISALFIANSYAIDPVSKIAKANEAKTLANEAYKKGDYKEAVKQYSYLLDTLDYSNEAAQLNKAHSLFFLKDTINAFDNYRTLSTAENKKIRSTSFLQMGNLAEQQKEYENALSYFKEAIKADPTNEDARYNYELLKKKMQKEEEQEQESDQDQQDQENQEDSEEKESEDKDGEGDDSDESQEGEDSEKSKEEQEAEDQKKKEEAEQEQQKDDKPGDEEGDKQEQQQKEGEEGEEEEQPPMKPSSKEKLEQMNISEDKAKMLLEALRNKEAQYFQQMRKKATERPKSGKPDW